MNVTIFRGGRKQHSAPRPHVGADPAGGVASVTPANAPPATYVLPTPPSVNECFRNLPGKGRVKTAVYLDWLGHAGWVLQSQHPRKVAGPVVLVIAVERGSHAADIDNRLKALIDLLVKHEAIDDDSNVVGLAAAWAPPASKQARVMILPAASYDFAFQLASDGASGGWFMHAPPPEQEPA